MAINKALFVALTLTMIGSLFLGQADISILSALSTQTNDVMTADRLILWEIRLPRSVLAPLVGAALGLAGAAMQSLVRNPLADPSLVGASQGAALGAAIAFYFGMAPLNASWMVPASAITGAIVALVAVLFLSAGRRPGLFILAGLAVASIGSALLAVALNFAPNPFAMQELILWLLGSVANRPIEMSLLMLVGLSVGGAIIFWKRHFLQALTLGDEVAQTLGHDPVTNTRWVLIACAILVGVSVAVAGAVSFVGLIIPHLLRRFVGSEPRRLLLPSMMGGALLVAISDVVIRTVPYAYDFKLGVITALIGAPFFVWIVLRERNRWL